VLKFLENFFNLYKKSKLFPKEKIYFSVQLQINFHLSTDNLCPSNYFTRPNLF